MQVKVTEHRRKVSTTLWNVTHLLQLNGQTFDYTQAVPGDSEPNGGHLAVARIKAEHYFRSQLEFEFVARPEGVYAAQ